MSAKTTSELRDLVRGDVIAPDDAEFEEARKVHNGMIDKRPAVIVRAANAGDAMTTVNYARDNGLDLSVRGGGHSGPGFGTNDGGVALDFSRMRGVRVDPNAQTARAEGGTTWSPTRLSVTSSRLPLGSCPHGLGGHLDHRHRRADAGRRHWVSLARMRIVAR